MFCKKCGFQISDSASFCTNCGTKAKPKKPLDPTDRKDWTEQEVLERVAQHQPINLSDPASLLALDAAVTKLAPSYSSGMLLDQALLACEPEQLRSAIDEADYETLLIAVKALGYHAGLGADRKLLGAIQKYMINVLKTRS